MRRFSEKLIQRENVFRNVANTDYDYCCDYNNSRLINLLQTLLSFHILVFIYRAWLPCFPLFRALLAALMPIAFRNTSQSLRYEHFANRHACCPTSGARTCCSLGRNYYQMNITFKFELFISLSWFKAKSLLVKKFSLRTNRTCLRKNKTDNFTITSEIDVIHVLIKNQQNLLSPYTYSLRLRKYFNKF